MPALLSEALEAAAPCLENTRKARVGQISGRSAFLWCSWTNVNGQRREPAAPGSTWNLGSSAGSRSLHRIVGPLFVPDLMPRNHPSHDSSEPPRNRGLSSGVLAVSQIISRLVVYRAVDPCRRVELKIVESKARAICLAVGARHRRHDLEDFLPVREGEHFTAPKFRMSPKHHALGNALVRRQRTGRGLNERRNETKRTDQRDCEQRFG